MDDLKIGGEGPASAEAQGVQGEASSKLPFPHPVANSNDLSGASRDDLVSHYEQRSTELKDQEMFQAREAMERGGSPEVELVPSHMHRYEKKKLFGGSPPREHSKEAWKRVIGTGKSPAWDWYADSQMRAAEEGQPPTHMDDWIEQWMEKHRTSVTEEHKEDVRSGAFAERRGVDLNGVGGDVSVHVAEALEDNLLAPLPRNRGALGVVHHRTGNEFVRYGDLYMGAYHVKQHTIEIGTSGESFAHEFFHALDSDTGYNWWGRVKMEFGTPVYASEGSGRTPEARELAKFTHLLGHSLSKTRGRHLKDLSPAAKRYFYEPKELLARFGEQMVSHLSHLHAAHGVHSTATKLAKDIDHYYHSPVHWDKRTLQALLHVWGGLSVGKRMLGDVEKAFGFGVMVKL